MKMTVSELRQILENLEKGDCGDFEIKFHCGQRQRE